MYSTHKYQDKNIYLKPLLRKNKNHFFTIRRAFSQDNHLLVNS